MPSTSEVTDRSWMLEQIIHLTTQLCHDTSFCPDDAVGQQNSERELVQHRLHLEPPAKDAILETLLTAETPMILAKELTSIHCDRAMDLIVEYNLLYEQTCNDIFRAGSYPSFKSVRRIAEQLQSKYYETERGWRDEMMTLVQSLPKNRSDGPPPYKDMGRKSFNHNFIPVLEAFFSKNSLPSRADKVFLARKSGMTFKQVHVWFQNRRCRSRKLSTACKEKSVSSPRTRILPATSYDSETEVDKGESDGELTSASGLSRCSSFTLVGDEQSFVTESPPHAFPMPYPPPPDMYPFPCRQGDFSMPKPTWYRTRCKASASSIPTSVDMDELTAAFERLTITNAETSGSLNVMEPYITRPFSAPLPSLVRTAPGAPISQSSTLSPSYHDEFDNAAQPHTLAFSGTLKSRLTKMQTISAFSDSIDAVKATSTRKRSGFPKRMPKSHSKSDPIAKRLLKLASDAQATPQQSSEVTSLRPEAHLQVDSLTPQRKIEGAYIPSVN